MTEKELPCTKAHRIEKDNVSRIYCKKTKTTCVCGMYTGVRQWYMMMRGNYQDCPGYKLNKKY